MDTVIDTASNDAKIITEPINDKVKDDDLNASETDEKKINNQADDKLVVTGTTESANIMTTTTNDNHDNVLDNSTEKIEDEAINYDDQDIEKSLAEMEGGDDDAEDLLNNKVVTVETIDEKNALKSNQSDKRKYSESKWASDDEGFAGFDDSSVNKPRRKKVKEEPMSDSEQCANDNSTMDIKVEVKSEHETEKDSEEESTNPTPIWPDNNDKEKSKPAAAKTNSTNNTPAPVTPSAAAVIVGPQTPVQLEPKYAKPFELGWKRELVYRSQIDTTRPKSDKAEVYYITPAGKKLRTKVEIQGHLQEGLDVTMFSFTRIALGMPPDQETVRTAKPKHSAAHRRPANFLDLGEPDPMFGFGKRVPKPKMPKGASPPPTHHQSPSSKSSNRGAQSNAKKLAAAAAASAAVADVIPLAVESDHAAKLSSLSSKSTKPRTKGEPCTIQCVLAMGTIPQLQCRKCFCLFHHECVVGMNKYDKPIANYICENCVYEMAMLNAPQTTANTSSVNNTTLTTLTSTNNGIQSIIAQQIDTKLPPVISSTQSIATTASIMIAPSTRTISYSQSTPTILSSSSGATTTTTHQQQISSLSNRNESKELNQSVIGSMTTWVPPTANVLSDRSQLDIETTPPQSIAIVAGRKYIMVPKTNLMSVSPSGEVRIGDNTGIPLPYVNDTTNSTRVNQNTPLSNSGIAAAPGTLTTGDDLISTQPTSLIKKRIVSSKNVSKTLTPAGSPSAHGPLTFHTQSPKAIINANSNSASVHRLFANDFFNNVSLGYDLLLHTFQYLKVQELLRASCVCRMWNQVANHPSLWKTVRMKNSQVNDWIGFVNTLKRNGTKHLDLRKMLISGNGDVTWQNFSDNIANVPELECIDLCRCSSQVVENLIASNHRLSIINAVSIKDDNIKLINLSERNQLTELRLKSLNILNIDSLSPLRHLIGLKHLSLTSIKDLGKKEIEVIGNLENLESLELGECSEFSTDFSMDVLSNLLNLERLRLEKGQDQCCLFDILETIAKMPKLSQLELVNFDIKTGFDQHLPKCTNLKRLLIIPTYISQSATTNHMVMKGILELADSLEQLTWVVTLELLRVTELYVDQYNCKRKEPKLLEDKIPVLKPIPGISDEEWRGRTVAQKTISDAPQVEIIPLCTIETFLAEKLPNTKCSILKVPYLATWRQNMTDLQ